MISAVRAMPKVNIAFTETGANGGSTSRDMYKYLTKRHRLKVISNKSIGIALVDLEKYGDFDSYLKIFGGKNSAAYYSRKAKKREYSFLQINRNDYIEDIHQINTSAEYRGGKKMTDWYANCKTNYEDEPTHDYFGVVDSSGKLVAYCYLGNFGEFSILTVILGHKNYLNDGIMYFMITEVIRNLYECRVEKGCRFLMYDTMLGAGTGLQAFKSKLGFQPYRVKWKWNVKAQSHENS